MKYLLVKKNCEDNFSYLVKCKGCFFFYNKLPELRQTTIGWGYSEWLPGVNCAME